MGWLRSNAAGLVALVLAAALAWFVFWISYLVPERDQYMAHEPVEVGVGQTADFAGARLTLLDVAGEDRYLDGSRLPDGTTLVLANVEIEPPQGGEFFCETELRLDGRQWPPAEDSAGVGYSFSGPLDGTASNCYQLDLDGDGGSYRVRLAYLVPTHAWDSFGTASVDIEVFESYPEFLRLEIRR